jgi:hypothetical protein
MLFDAITSKITRLRLSFAAIIAGGIICIVALIFLFPKCRSQANEKK